MPKKNARNPQRALFASNLSTRDGIVDNIVEAGKQRKTVTITYTDSKGETTTRETEPYEIKGDKYYGFSLDKNSIRAFNIGNIGSVTINDKGYNARWDVKF